VGDGSPGSRKAEGEGGEGFYIAQSGRSPDLLVILGEGGGREGDPVIHRLHFQPQPQIDKSSSN